MLIISGSTVELEPIKDQLHPDEVETEILNILYSSNKVYEYSSINELVFELNQRKSIIRASTMLFESRLRFRTFRKSMCNEQLWNRTEEGGFILRQDTNPAEAINDIFLNGPKYGTECATAIVIIYYKALLDTFGENLFNTLFGAIYLMDWQSLQGNLTVNYYRNPSDFFPGDCRYFKNPDVNPLTPEWQGENAIDLGYGYYYGHGIGIRTSGGIIESLNKHRKDGSNISAYLLDSCALPDFKRLFNLYSNYH